MHGSAVSFLAPALGFASNLSHTIIREQREDDEHSLRSDTSSTTDISISDEELALLGPPWAKEGMLCRKQYWESTGKRAKSKAWMDVFVVIQKGELSMFVFGDHSVGGAAVVGGGNWLVSVCSCCILINANDSDRKMLNQSVLYSLLTLWRMPYLHRDTTDNVHTVWCSLWPMAVSISSKRAQKSLSMSGYLLAITGLRDRAKSPSHLGLLCYHPVNSPARLGVKYANSAMSAC